MTSTLLIPRTVDGLPTVADHAAAGKALRERVPRSAHSAWSAGPDRIDPLAILGQTSSARIGALVPLRNARMAASPFTFFRGGADIMAADLAGTPVNGLRVQLSGDAHCLNFGVFATPERRLIFDVNDFDETLPGPWEWDLKRLAASLVLAGRSIKLKADSAAVAVLAAVRTYRLEMLDLAPKSALAIWYTRIDASSVGPTSESPDRQPRRSIVDSANARSMQAAVDEITVVGPNGRLLREAPPLLYHPTTESDGNFDVARVLETYAESLAPEVRVLFGRYRLVDHAIKVVGVGSVGMRCSVALLQAASDDVLILQIKEALPSVLERYAGASLFPNHGRRVVAGQRLMQAAGDALLGWGSSDRHDFYVRQFRDKKVSVDIAALDGFGLREYAQKCALALAKAHARSGDGAQIAGYLGKSDIFDKAIVRFALLYADQVEQDYSAFRAAIAAGRFATA